MVAYVPLGLAGIGIILLVIGALRQKVWLCSIATSLASVGLGLSIAALLALNN